MFFGVASVRAIGLERRRIALARALLVLASLAVLIGISLHASAQTPVISSITPSTVTAGGPAFSLTIAGINFTATSGVVINGTTLAPASATATQLIAIVPASLIAAPGLLPVTAFNLSFTGGRVTSNAVTLTVGAAAALPVLTSASPEFPVQGANQVRMTLVGSNFRPGATVIISPPLASLSASTGKVQAGDISIVGVTVVNSGLMTASINVSPKAAEGLRAVDVLNADGTSTAVGIGTFASGSSQPAHVQLSSSLGAPITILNMGLLHPRDGTVVMRGQELYADAIMAGSGTGTVVGQWVWDGNVVEQFAVSLVGGNSTTIRTKQSLPTAFLGAHRLQLRMIQPNQVASVPVTVVVNPGDWKLEQLIFPEAGRGFEASQPPSLLWEPVPGAEEYQVGFSSQPYLSTIRSWFDVVDNRWQVPPGVWMKLPEGKIYWTVRTIDSNGVARKPLPMRTMYRIIDGGLSAVAGAPSHTATGRMLLEWKPSQTDGFYFVTVSRDVVGTQIVRQYLTRDPKVDLRAVDGKLLVGMTYYWQVDALTPAGQLLYSGPVQSFVAQPGTHAELRGAGKLVLLASLGTPPSLPGFADLANEISGQKPAPGSSTNEVQPEISVNFQPAVNPADVSVMVDGVDITSLAQITQDKLTFTPPLALTGGEHDVNLTVGNDATTWKFSVTAALPQTAAAAVEAPASAAGTDAEAPSTSAAVMPKATEIAVAHHQQLPDQKNLVKPSIDGQIGANTQWVSGSNPPDTNVLSAAEHIIYEKGPWHHEANGSRLLNSVLRPEVPRSSRGQGNDYVLQAGFKQERWSGNLRFGIVSPVLYTDAQFVTAATPRQGAEVTLKSVAGALGYFVNTDDTALGGGSGINFHQQLMGASYQAPLPKWAEFKFMWLRARDTGAPTTVGYDSQGNPIILPNPVAPTSAGDVLGALLNLNFEKTWLWSSEYAISYDNANTSDPASIRQFGRAWRSGVSGQVGKMNANASYHEVSANFGNPANPNLTQSSQPNLRGVDASMTDGTRAGNFGVTYSFLDNNVHPTTTDELRLNSFDESWNKALGVKTSLTIESRQSLTRTGAVPAALQGLPPDQTGAQDLRDISGSINLSRQIGEVSTTAGASRDWSRNNLTPIADTITSSVNAGINLATHGFFQLNAQFTANWVAANQQTVGTTTNYTVYVQPTFGWKKPALQISPLATVTKGKTVLANNVLSSDTLTGQYGGRVSWTLPGVLKFSTFSAQGTYNQNRNTIAGLDQNSTQLLVLWTATWSHKRTF